MLPVTEDGALPGSICSLGLPPGTRSFCSVAAALEAKALPATLLTVLGPAPVAKPKAILSANPVKAKGTPAPLVAIKPLPPPKTGDVRAVIDAAPLLPTDRVSDWQPPLPPPPPPPPQTPPPPPPPPPPASKTTAKPSGPIPGTEDVKDTKDAGSTSADVPAKCQSKGTDAKQAMFCNDEVDLSALIIFSDASALGVAEVARELLWQNECHILVDRPCELTAADLRLLGLQPWFMKDGQRHQNRSWWEHLQNQRHWLFVVRRSGALALLLQICFGPTVRRRHLRSSSYGPFHSKWPFLQVPEGMRPLPKPMIPSLQHLLQVPESPGVGFGAPAAATTCHSRLHAMAVVAQVSPELVQHQEVALVVPAIVGEEQFDELKMILSRAPLSYVELFSATGNDMVPICGGPIQCLAAISKSGEKTPTALPFTALQQGLGCVAKDVWLSLQDGKQGLARVVLFSRVAAAQEVQAMTNLSSQAAGQDVKCSLREAYKSLVDKNAALIWRPGHVDQIIASVWPQFAVPRADGSFSLSLADRCVRLAGLDGVEHDAGVLATGRPRRDLTSWPKSAVKEVSREIGTEVMISTQRILVQEVADERHASAMSSARLALRKLTLLKLCRGCHGTFSCAVLHFPREAAAEDHLWASVAVRKGIPWRPLDKHPEAYLQKTHCAGVKLTAAELSSLEVEGGLVVKDIGDGKVLKGWRLCPGGDLPSSKLGLASLLGVDVKGFGDGDGLTHCVASLAATLAATNETATLFFEKVTQELAAPISKQQALKADLCLEERGEQIFGDIIPVPRRQHMQAEAMLIGANLARVAVSNEVPIQSHAASAAFRDATKALRGISESLRQLFSSGGNAPDWLWQPSTVSRTCLRLLCNEPVGDVIEAWRLLSSENRVTDDREYFTELFLSLSCYGEYIAAPEANCIGVEGLFFARNVLVNFNGAQPTLRLWGALPVLAKPGRFAAQIWAMLRLDESLKSFGEAQEALSDGFFQRYCQDAPGGAEKAEPSQQSRPNAKQCPPLHPRLERLSSDLPSSVVEVTAF
ncbi:unnamed protein product [Effrenium voratum]|nr:unnamed protein product [Effrenium voratum]